ncbi:MAG: hypothetical protein ACP5GL_02690 [Infirmifilum sp.]|jgi:hypothetical protein|uniref:hypothetical protein n=1 Tax=Infirmifilum sp. TaxID=2856575 RepID=UPI0023525C88
MESLSCKRCGAPLSVDPESLIAVCDYCGYPNIIGGDFSSEHVSIIPSKTREVVENKFIEVVKKDPQLSKIEDIEVLEISGAYFPAWYTTIRANVRASWYTTVIEERNNRVITRRVLQHEERTISRKIFLPARRRIPSEPVLNALASYTVKKAESISPTREDFDWEKIKLEFLGVEIGRQEALRILTDKFIDSLREEYKSRGEQLDFFSASIVKVEEPVLLYVPVWTISYTAHDSVYLAVFDGYDLTCLYRSEPLTSLERIAGFSLGLALSSLSGPIFAATASLTGFETSLLFLGLLATAGYTITKSAMASARVENA